MARLVGNMLVPRQSCCQSVFPEEDSSPWCWHKAGVMEKCTGSRLMLCSVVSLLSVTFNLFESIVSLTRKHLDILTINLRIS